MNSGKIRVGQPGLRPDRDVDVEQLVGRVRATVGFGAARVPQRSHSGESGSRLHVVAADRTGADDTDHRGGRRLDVRAVADVPVGELDERVTGVRGDVQPVVAVGGRVGEAVGVGGEPPAEALPRPSVQVGPRAAVVRPLHGEVLGVAARRVVRGGQRVLHHRCGLGQLVGHPAGRVERQPLGRRIAVLEVRGDFARRVLGARGHRADLVEQAAGQSGGARSAQVRLDRLAVRVDLDGARRGLRVERLERGAEVAGWRCGAAPRVRRRAPTPAATVQQPRRTVGGTRGEQRGDTTWRGLSSR